MGRVREFGFVPISLLSLKELITYLFYAHLFSLFVVGIWQGKLKIRGGGLAFSRGFVPKESLAIEAPKQIAYSTCPTIVSGIS